MYVRIHNLPSTAEYSDIKSFFEGLRIAADGIKILGGIHGDAFITFMSEVEADIAMCNDGKNMKGARIKLFRSNESEMQYEMKKKMRDTAPHLLDYDFNRSRYKRKRHSSNHNQIFSDLDKRLNIELEKSFDIEETNPKIHKRTSTMDNISQGIKEFSQQYSRRENVPNDMHSLRTSATIPPKCDFIRSRSSEETCCSYSYSSNKHFKSRPINIYERSPSSVLHHSSLSRYNSPRWSASPEISFSAKTSNYGLEVEEALNDQPSPWKNSECDDLKSQRPSKMPLYAELDKHVTHELIKHGFEEFSHEDFRKETVQNKMYSLHSSVPTYGISDEPKNYPYLWKSPDYERRNYDEAHMYSEDYGVGISCLPTFESSSGGRRCVYNDTKFNMNCPGNKILHSDRKFEGNIIKSSVLSPENQVVPFDFCNKDQNLSPDKRSRSNMERVSRYDHECVVQLSNVNISASCEEFHNFLKKFVFYKDSIVRKYTAKGAPTSDVRVTFYNRWEAEEAIRELNNTEFKSTRVSMKIIY